MAITFIVNAVALYKSPHLIASSDPNNIIGINVDRLQGFSPRLAWVKRYLVPGQNQVQALLTFEPTSAEQLDPNTIVGLYIEIDGQGVVIDCISIANFISVANGVSTSFTQTYPGGVPAFVSPVPSAFCVVRADDGSGSAHNNVVKDYVTQYIGNIVLRSNFSGVSHYTMNSYTTPIPIGSDIISSGACSS